MQVQITVGGEGGFTKKFDTDYYTLECNDWNDIMQELLDYGKDAEDNK